MLLVGDTDGFDVKVFCPRLAPPIVLPNAADRETRQLIELSGTEECYESVKVLFEVGLPAAAGLGGEWGVDLERVVELTGIFACLEQLLSRWKRKRLSVRMRHGKEVKQGDLGRVRNCSCDAREGGSRCCRRRRVKNAQSSAIAFQAPILIALRCPMRLSYFRTCFVQEICRREKEHVCQLLSHPFDFLY